MSPLRRPSILPSACLLLGWLLALLVGAPAARAAEDAKPSLTVILEQNELLAGGSLRFSFWIENPSDLAMSDVALRLSGPDYIRLGEVGPDGCRRRGNPGGAVALPDLPPRSALENPVRLCLAADPVVEERDFNLAFSLAYRVGTGTAARTGVLVGDKRISVGLFGTDSVAGVSLRLAAYFVPGLLLLLLLRLGRIPWVDQLVGAESATVSVLVSVALWYGSGLLARWLPVAPGAGVSASLFLVLCGAAILVGVAACIVAAVVRSVIRRRRDALLVEPNDGAPGALLKALSLRGAGAQPVTVVAADQTQYVGSAAAPTRDGGLALLGWFELRPTAAQGELRRELRSLLARRRYADALRLALDERLAVEPRNMIRRLAPGGGAEPTELALRRFRKGELREHSSEPVTGLDVQEPPVVLL
jgi:hypothetical protein